MFPFRKKTEKTEREKEEKERRKKEKRERKERLKGMDTSVLSADEMSRLEEMRKTFKGIEKAKQQQQQQQMHQRGGGGGEDNVENTNYDSGASGGSAETSSGSTRTWSTGSGSLTRSSLGAPPRPPSRGILKGQNYNVGRSVSSELDDASVLLKNTQANEMLLYENVKGGKSPKSPLSPAKESLISPGESADRELAVEHVAATTKVRAHKDHVSPVSPAKHFADAASGGVPPKRPSSMTKPMSSAELRSLVGGEAVGINLRPLSSDFSIQLPGDCADRDVDEEWVKVVTLEKRRDPSGRKGCEGDSYGVELVSRAVSRVGRGVKRDEEVVLVESQDSGVAGLISGGDQVIEVNGESCVGKSLAEVTDMVRRVEQAGDAKLTLKVRHTANRDLRFRNYPTATPGMLRSRKYWLRFSDSELENRANLAHNTYGKVTSLLGA